MFILFLGVCMRAKRTKSTTMWYDKDGFNQSASMCSMTAGMQGGCNYLVFIVCIWCTTDVFLNLGYPVSALAIEKDSLGMIFGVPHWDGPGWFERLANGWQIGSSPNIIQLFLTQVPSSYKNFKCTLDISATSGRWNADILLVFLGGTSEMYKSSHIFPVKSPSKVDLVNHSNIYASLVLPHEMISWYPRNSD